MLPKSTSGRHFLLGLVCLGCLSDVVGHAGRGQRRLNYSDQKAIERYFSRLAKGSEER
jgi:hypothetical protein